MKTSYKLIPLVFLTFSCLGYANTTEEQILDTKSQIAKLQAELQKLEAIKAKEPKSIAQQKVQATLEQDKANELKTHAEFGFVSTSGNTDTNAYNLDLKMKKGYSKHLFKYTFDGQYADDNNVQTKNKFFTELTYDYEVTNRFAFDYLSGYKKDRFSGYNYQFYTGPGAKYKFIKEEQHKLSLQGNILYAEDELDTGLTKDYTSLRAKAAYEWKILENLTFTQDFTYRSELENTSNYFLFSKTAFISKISDVFSLGLNYKVDYANIAPLGKVNSDKTFTASLIIDY